MAEPGKGKLGCSPKEDFNPLDENIGSYGDQRDQTSDHDADRSSGDDHGADHPLHSLEGQLEDLCIEEADQLPFSPPTSSRFSKREKVRRNSGRRSVQKNKENEKSKKPKVVVSFIKERYSESNALYSGLAHADSDADLERGPGDTRDKEKRKRDREDKLKSKVRQQEILSKREDLSTVSENIASNTAPMDINTPVVPVKLEGSGRFVSLGLPSTSCRHIALPILSSDKLERRPAVSSFADCPNERLIFFKTFQALINMGSQGKKQKEQKEKERMFPQRQKSAEEDLYMSIIWIGLQAWLNGMSLEDQQKMMDLEREKIPHVLNEIMEFQVQFPQSNCVQNNSTGGSESHNRDSSCSVDTTVTDITESYHTMYVNQDMIQQQQQAVIQVERLLEKLDKCEQLYRSDAVFAASHPKYKEPTFIQRTEALYLWLNTTKDLCHKINVLGQVFNISAEQGWRYISFNREDNVQSFDRQINRESIPEIVQDDDYCDDDDTDAVYTENSQENSEQNKLVTNSCESSGSEKSEQQKRVSFQMSEPRRDVSSSNTSRLVSPVSSPKRDLSPSQFGSPPDSSTPLRAQFSSASLSRASSEASLDDLGRSLYRAYVDKGLKKIGLSKMLIRLRDILYTSLRRARQSLEYRSSDSEVVDKSPSDEYYQHSSPTLDLLDKSPGTHLESHPTEKLRAWRDEFLEIGLPSYRPTYIFLLQVLLDVIHEAMKIRLEQLQNPIGEPSFLSIRQLIIECKDMLAKAVMVKQDYQCMVQAVLDDHEAQAENSPLDLERFDDDMCKMFKMYFQYLQNWLYHLQNLPEASRSLKNPLEEEWNFTKKICPHIISGEAEAGKRFSTMAISLLNSISDFLETGVDECTSDMFDWTLHGGEMSSSEEESEEDHDTSRNKSSSSLRKSFQATCRRFKSLFHEARERASKALGFAKLLRKDLEIAADFNVAVSMPELLQKLKDSDHINVIAQIGMISAGYLMFIPRRIGDQRRHIIQLLNVTCGREDVSASTDITSRDDAYLVMVRCGAGTDLNAECPTWSGESIQVEPTAETAIALSHIWVESLLLVVIHSSQLSTQRREFENLMGSTVELVNEQTSCHQIIVESLYDLKESAISLRGKVASVIQQVESNWSLEMEMEEHEKKHILKLYRETMLQAYDFGFEYMKEVTRLVSGETRHKLGPGSMAFAKDWMMFVSEKCERGRGMRPRWANQGLDFLLIACEPKNLAVLTEQEYKDLQEMLNDFITHLIGNADKASHFGGHGGPLPKPRHGGEIYSRQQYQRYPSWPTSHGEGRMARSQSSKLVAEGPTVPQSAPVVTNTSSQPRLDKRASDSAVDIHEGEDGGIVMEVHPRHRGSDGGLNLCASHNMFSYKPHTRMVTAIENLERSRQEALRERKVIGHVTEHREVSYHVNTRKVNFHWQKGNKIGEGQFGKVYSAVNMDTGVLMAMKEMKFPSADMQSHFKDIIDEIKIFEGISHPNLVKYFGVEVHRSEMLVFMEYCDRGTIDEVSRIGLTEDLIRKYTKELIRAVQVLHDNKIVHRDIKGANIFLTSSGCLKLGDFGCSVKLKNHTTMVGEVNKLVGTTAYMAPEVVTKNDSEGHGRAADIWSIGCVVIEMASGKRPWHEFENNFQIMFKLGMGAIPSIPEMLSEEGRDFLSHCLEIDPDHRWSTSQLLDHPFTKIYDPEADEEGASEGHG
ncbi:mitogen-activated protein kinase kinase kinase 4-like isoform X2 [Mya arenaria]|uniref:mitogen-activated protein kinase kinase kinase 4-like isoform X2 n=1 Tax=Mya arenaria TaxID=6604 RepID=UPI0022E77FC4|nr:mitogen-activated protein kinase kinase kinase 4-like isoform X2 [Mya arenaria]